MHFEFKKADAAKLPYPDDRFDLVIGSPPYIAARTYGIAADKQTRHWVAWMLRVTTEALRVSRGPVVWICAGTKNYNPGPEGLIWHLHQRKLVVLRPAIWHAPNKPPTNAGRWFSNQWEYIICVTSQWPLPYFDASCVATTQKYSVGGAFRQRRKDGTRRMGGAYPVSANGRRKTVSNVFVAGVGGGHMGHKIAHENEAPFPEKIVDPLIRVLCPPGGRVLDPFSGSGTTVAAAVKCGRMGYGTDIRQSEIRKGIRRMKDVVAEIDAINHANDEKAKRRGY